ncbi:hypothetical protein HX096_16495 [Empedobacter falsenii]|uniref:hypothetical protein n=1 Tax=Empedobacter falsenii TaxID=343874 RepID=UPI002578EB55|nr:hypothetical protein [Empedobacter falsenii]MDM1549455.1 hypothetical protein [Empedobacter falsenii]
MKNDFLLYEFWILSVQGGFQRSNAYKKETSDKERIAFRKALKQFVDTELVPQYQMIVSDNQHENNIITLCNYSKENYEHLFVKGSLNIGVSQKLLNLYLKYQWCAGWIETPPHFPVDRIIQQKLNVKPLKPWTKFEDINDYRNVIDFAKKEFSKMNYNSLAEMELNIFERR